MDAHLTPQEAIDKRRPKPSQCDIVVVVLWSRMGTPLPPEHRKPDGRPYVSGTEYEFCDAMDAAKRTGKPTTLVYRRTEEPKIGLGDRDLDEKHRQYRGVETFFAEFTSADGSLRQSFTPYGSPSEFADKLERALRELIQVHLEAHPKEAPARAKDDASEAAIARDTTAKPAWEGNPYRGLKAFRERHAAIFFGRGRKSMNWSSASLCPRPASSRSSVLRDRASPRWSVPVSFPDCTEVRSWAAPIGSPCALRRQSAVAIRS